MTYRSIRGNTALYNLLPSLLPLSSTSLITLIYRGVSCHHKKNSNTYSTYTDTRSSNQLVIIISCEISVYTYCTWTIKKCVERRKGYECSFLTHIFSVLSILPSPFLNAKWWKKCPGRWVRMNSFLPPGAKCTDPTWLEGPQWLSDPWPLELIEANDLMRCSYEEGEGSV